MVVTTIYIGSFVIQNSAKPKGGGKILMQQTLKSLKKVYLSENQKKVIADKYLRDTPTVEEWLYAVAKNIALAELLYDPRLSLPSLLDGVRYSLSQIPVGKGGFSSLFLLHDGIYNSGERDANHKKFIANLYRASEDGRGREAVEETAQKFYRLLSNFLFLPNSPTLMNAGRELQQLSACYVLPVDDSIDGWGDVAKQTMLVHKSGGGTGFSGCRVRPKGDKVKSTSGVASGAISPFTIINFATEEVKQGGTRRGANMGILPYWHPDIFEFMSIKEKEGRLDNFNISVAVDSAFITAVREDGEYALINPRNKEVVGKARAREVFDKICLYAWKTGDPGVIFIDRINNSFSNPTPALGEIEATNPCGEQPLLPYEPCNLGSINLHKFVRDGEIDFAALGEAVALCTRFLDNVIDVNNYPLAEIERIAKGNRRIGLGVMGWAEMMAEIEVPYDSEEALQKAEEVMKFINQKSLEESCALAEERGVFPNFRNSIYDEEGEFFRPWAGKVHPRNCARTTIAPTGTIAIAAGLQGGGIEPFFAISYTRYNAKALDAIKKGEKPDEKDVFHEVSPLFKKAAEEHHFFGLKGSELWKKIEVNHGSVKGIPEIPESIQSIFSTAHDVPVEWHVKHQAAFQKHVDNGVSKTINLPNSATLEDVKRTYLAAHELACKGITIYRDGCKSQQVLNLSKAQEEKRKRDLSEGAGSHYYKFDTGYGPVHIQIVHDEDNMPFRVFTNTTPVGTEISGLTVALGIMISKYLEIGGDVHEVRKHLNSIKSDKPYGLGPKRIESIPHAVSVALNRFLKKTGGLQGGAVDETVAVEERMGEPQVLVEHCPSCYSPNIAYLSGCSGPTCYECGYSECS